MLFRVDFQVRIYATASVEADTEDAARAKVEALEPVIKSWGETCVDNPLLILWPPHQCTSTVVVDSCEPLTSAGPLKGD